MTKTLNGVKDNKFWWKIAACALGVLMIIGAIIYIVKSRAAAVSVPTASVSDAPVTGIPRSVMEGDTGELKWVKALREKYASSDFIFVLLPASDEKTVSVEQSIRNTCEKMKQDGLSVEIVTLNPNDAEFSITLERLAIQKLPAVLIFSISGQTAVIKGKISEEKLSQAYLTMMKTCLPGSSGCCPGK